MLVIDDEDLADTIRKALEADPQTTNAALELLVDGCEQIERFETALQIARDPRDLRSLNAALDEAHDAFGDLIDIFGEILTLATQLDADGEA